ncbi:ketoacyl-ACP synthase III [Desulfovibrio sp. OttesenSCG-928-C14]|nr:ketoacyl-ACP synthase III [Desulfovibrio sp. OttesenSCG-928-C14]
MAFTPYINAFGYYAPERILDNFELSKIVDTNDEWIRTRTGISERRIAAPGQNCSDMGLICAKKALEATGMDPSELTMIVDCTVTGDSPLPTTACRLQTKLGLKDVMAFDVNAACSGFLYGLHIARGLLAAEPDSKILLLATEMLSLRTNWTDRSTCVLFGDGAGAVLISNEKRPVTANPLSLNALIEGVLCRADGSHGELLQAKGGGADHPYHLGSTVGEEFFIQMQGREVYKLAVRSMTGLCKELMDSLGYGIGDIDLLIPHQANMRIIQAVGERLEVPEDKVFINVQKYGNTSAASVALALGEAVEQGVIKPGMRVLLTSFGGGMTWGSAIIKF